MQSKHLPRLTLQCIAAIVTVLLVLGGTALFLYQKNRDKVELVYLKNGQQSVQSVAYLFEYEIGNVLSDIRFLSKMKESAMVFEGASSGSLAENLLFFSLDKKAYDQIRYLDHAGMERFRINYNAGTPTIVKRKDLQDKSDRYYFRNSRDLKLGNFYISRFDLNVEHGKVELPFKPILRFAGPLFDSTGHHRGTIFLNYFGNHMLRLLDRGTEAEGATIALVNEDGYWLSNPDPAKEWGFMIPGREGATFQASYPDEWTAIQGRTAGSLRTGKGLFVFRKQNPRETIGELFGKETISDAGTWTLVYHVPESALMAEPRAYLRRMAGILIPLGLLLTIAIVLVCRFRHAQIAARQALLQEQESYTRFVPKEFLELLGTGEYSDLSLDSHANCNLTVLFSDIRSYTKLSESLTHKQVIDFLNDYFMAVNTPIKGNGGFVDSFHGDALLALFAGDPHHAVRAAVEMRHTLAEYNEGRAAKGLQPVATGIGLHFGEVTLGALGSEDRMQATVIGDVVNLAARIESSTKVFGVHIVISDSVRDNLPDPDAFLLREIDTVRVKGKNVPVVLYEVFDADPELLIRAKLDILPLFAQGLAHYKAGRFEEAIALFEQCAEQCPDDTITPIYLKRCKTMLRIPPGDGWTGVSTL